MKFQQGEIVEFFEGVVSEHFQPVMTGIADHHNLLAAALMERNINLGGWFAYILSGDEGVEWGFARRATPCPTDARCETAQCYAFRGPRF